MINKKIKSNLLMVLLLTVNVAYANNADYEALIRNQTKIHNSSNDVEAEIIQPQPIIPNTSKNPSNEKNITVNKESKESNVIPEKKIQPIVKNVTVSTKSSVSDAELKQFFQKNIDNPDVIMQASKKFNFSIQDLVRATGYSNVELSTYFKNAGLVMNE